LLRGLLQYRVLCAIVDSETCGTVGDQTIAWMKFGRRLVSAESARSAIEQGQGENNCDSFNMSQERVSPPKGVEEKNKWGARVRMLLLLSVGGKTLSEWLIRNMRKAFAVAFRGREILKISFSKGKPLRRREVADVASRRESDLYVSEFWPSLACRFRKEQRG